MAKQSTYSKEVCHFCGRVISRNGLGRAKHYRTHVKSGEALEIHDTHPEYRGKLEFIPKVQL
jgi:hypothetical protein